MNMWTLWLKFFSRILEYFCPLSYKLPKRVSFYPDGSQFAQMGFHIASNVCTLPFLGYRHTQKKPTHPKTPLFLAWTGKWAKWTTVWAKWDPNWVICLKRGQNFSRSGQKNLFMWTLQQRLSMPQYGTLNLILNFIPSGCAGFCMFGFCNMSSPKIESQGPGC